METFRSGNGWDKKLYLAQYFSMAMCIQSNATTKTAMIQSVFLIVQVAELYCP